MITRPQDNLKLIDILIEAIGNRGEVERVPEVFSEGWLDHSVWANPLDEAGKPVGDEPVRTSLVATRANIQAMRHRFPDLHTTIDKLVDAGDHVIVVSSTRATHRSGPAVTHRGIEIHRIKDGRIVESWSAWDRLGLGQQLGLILSTAELFALESGS